jgi:ribosome-associated toxin RatA of RatAB toxin-antitoxin module
LKAVLPAVFLALLASAPARAQDLMALLADGPVMVVKKDAKGKFEQATAVIDVKAPPAKVWNVVTNFSAYRYFMPKVEKSEQSVPAPNQLDVAYEINVPLSNAKYTIHYNLDPVNMTATGNWAKGDLKGTHSLWRIVPYKDETLVYFTTATLHFNALAQRFEDSEQTITVGVNVVAALTTVTAIKKRAEGMTAGAAPPPSAAAAVPSGPAAY